MTTLGLIGSGNIGGTVARLAVNAGYDVVLSNSRGPDTLTDLVTELGPHASAATADLAGEAGDLVLVSVPLKAYQAIPVEPLAGKVVLDTNNYYPERDGTFPDLEAKTATTSGLLQAHLPDSHVVKVFNNIYFQNLLSMARPAGAPDRNTLIIAGDDATTKKTAANFLDAIGYDAVDSGSLADSWRYERDQPAYASAYVVNGDFSHTVPADAAKLTSLLAQATR